jgi:predicted RNase H-like HicB family nuclease
LAQARPQQKGGWLSAYVPDLPGCVAVGETREEVLGLIREAIAFQKL